MSDVTKDIFEKGHVFDTNCSFQVFFTRSGPNIQVNLEAKRMNESCLFLLLSYQFFHYFLHAKLFLL